MADYYAFGSGGLQETARQIFTKIKMVFAKNTRDTVLFPNFDGLTPLATYTYNIASAAYYRICSRVNTGLTDVSAYDDVLLFRITVTGANINEVADVYVQGSMAIAQPIAIAFNRTLSVTAATTGVRYLRFNYPKAINSGHGWDIEFYAYNATARTVKVEVFATTPNVTWESELTPSTYNSDNQSTASMTLYTNRGLVVLGTVPIAASSASTSTYITGYLPLFVGGTQPVAGEALTANSLILFSGNKAYKASNKTVAITPEVGLAFLSNATSSGSAVAYNYVRQKASWTSLGGDSSMSKATIARGNPVYLRCTLDSSGNIKSDAYLSPTMAAGYTWCYVGVAQSASAINVDCTHPLFLTLDANGKLTHVNGHAVANAVTSINGQTGAVTLNIPTKTSDLTNDSGFIDSSLGITGASVGQYAEIAAVDESGAPTAWQPSDLKHTLTITLTTENSAVVDGATVTIRYENAEGGVYATLPYNQQPVSVSLPIGFKYYITVDQYLTYETPVPVAGVVFATDVSVSMMYRTAVRYGFRRAKADSSPSDRIEYLFNAVGMTPAGMTYGSDGVGVFSKGTWGPFIDSFARPVMLTQNGVVDYELNHDNQSLKLDGETASDVSNTTYNGNAMVEFGSKFKWIKRYEDENYQYVIFCNSQYDNTYHAYAHTNANGEVKDAFYLSMFTGPYVGGAYLRSFAGQANANSQNAEVEISRASQNGPGYNIYYKSAWDYLADALTLISKTDDSQTAFGTGVDARKNSITSTGTLIYHGPFYGTNDGESAVKVWWVENPWGNIWQRLAGYINNQGSILVKMAPPYCDTPVSDADYSTYIQTGQTMSGTSGGYAKGCVVNDTFGLVTTVCDGSATTYLCDGGQFNNSRIDFALAGAASANAAGFAGSRCVFLVVTASTADSTAGARLTYIPI